MKIAVGIFKAFEVMQSGGLAGIFLNSMLLGVLVVIGATIFAFPLAFIMSKTDVGKYSKLDIVFMIPFMTPPYIDRWAGFCSCNLTAILNNFFLC